MSIFLKTATVKNLIETWRSGWSAEAGTTDATFPFGLVSLAGGTSEGHAPNMGAFRFAQTGNTGVLPNDKLPGTLVAQAFDTGDPCSGGSQCCTNSKDGQGGWACESGEAPYTGQFMGGIHPRVKKIVDRVRGLRRRVRECTSRGQVLTH